MIDRYVTAGDRRAGIFLVSLAALRNSSEKICLTLESFMTSVLSNSPRRAALSAVMLAVGLMATSAFAVPTITNLTLNTYGGFAPDADGSAVINGATFAFNTQQPAGTGVFNPFLRLQLTGATQPGQQGSEQGYNTSALNVLDNKAPVNWTHDLLISSLQKTPDGLNYQFTLDINESNSASGKSLLSLDGLRLFSTSQPGQSGNNTYGNTAPPNLAGDVKYSPDVGGIIGTKLFDLDTATIDNSVLLDANRSGNPPGSGVADMIFLVPKAVIDNRVNQGENYLILWSRFGTTETADALNLSGSTADAGFEEWSYRSSVGSTTSSSGSSGGSSGSSGAVPSPGSSALTLLALAAMGATFRARKLAPTAA